MGELNNYQRVHMNQKQWKMWQITILIVLIHGNPLINVFSSSSYAKISEFFFCIVNFLERKSKYV